jgi:diaminopimelate epimerase
MDGAGNDFVVVDLRRGGEMSEAAARHLGDRSGPFGCDQIIGIASGSDTAMMLIWNADGSEAGACGNAARCVADLLMEERTADSISFGSPSGPLAARRAADQLVAVDMGRPRLAWHEIPVSRELSQTLELPVDASVLDRYGLTAPVGVSMGNPHAVFFVADAEREPLAAFGPLIEHDPLFPDRVNCSVASIQNGVIRLRTWERGVGVTRACGTAACASLVAASRLDLLGRRAKVVADGGELAISWDERTGRVEMAGPTRLHRSGVL